MPTEPPLTSSPARHAGVLAGAAALAAGIAAGFAWMLSGTGSVGGMAALVTAVAWLPALAPVALGRHTVPSRFGNAVLIGSMGHTLATLGFGMLVITAVEIERRAFMSGLVAGGFVLLAAQAGYAVLVLRDSVVQRAGGAKSDG